MTYEKTQNFISKSIAKHGDKYLYSKTCYLNNVTPVTIICRTHGEFTQKPMYHLVNGGCRLCGIELKSSNRTDSLAKFLTKAKEVHGETYDYSKVEYTHNTSKVLITCRTHGEFYQTPNSHLQGRGCRKCGYEKLSTNYTGNSEDFISKAKKVHGDLYDYSEVQYVDSYVKVKVLCKNHGIFEVSPNNHIGNSSGCPKCGHRVSTGELEIFTWLQSEGFNVTRGRIHNLELDIFLPSENIAIEYNGLYWHSEERLGRTYHLNKTQLCIEKGIRLIHIFEDEWYFKQTLLKTKILHILNKTREVAVFARKTTICNPTNEETTKFLTDNHIQGPCKASIYIGLKYLDDLVAIATFSKSRFKDNDGYELVRYSTSCKLVGGLGKILKAFHYKYPEITRLVSYSDLRWSVGNIYNKLGFTLESTSPPGYFWCKGLLRLNRQTFMKHKLEKILPIFDSSKTEEENCLNNGYFKVFDCGHQKWVKTF